MLAMGPIGLPTVPLPNFRFGSKRPVSKMLHAIYAAESQSDFQKRFRGDVRWQILPSAIGHHECREAGTGEHVSTFCCFWFHGLMGLCLVAGGDTAHLRTQHTLSIDGMSDNHQQTTGDCQRNFSRSGDDDTEKEQQNADNCERKRSPPEMSAITRHKTPHGNGGDDCQQQQVEVLVAKERDSCQRTPEESQQQRSRALNDTDA